MQKIKETGSWATYASRPRIMLVFGVVFAIALAAAFYFELPLLPRLVLGFFTVLGFLVGLSSETLRLDFENRRLSYRERFAGFVSKSIDGHFEQVEKILVHGVFSRSADGRTADSTPSGWKVVLAYKGREEAGMDVGTFVGHDDAMREARHLSERLKAPIEELHRE